MDFGRALAKDHNNNSSTGQKLKQKFILTNNGLLDAEVRIKCKNLPSASETETEAEPLNVFTIREDKTIKNSTKCSYFSNSKDRSYNACVTIASKKKSAFEIEFSPSESRDNFTGELSFMVLHNPYEMEKILLKGTGYHADIFMESEYSNQVLNFGEINIGDRKKTSITLCNRSQYPYRVQWPSVSYLNFEPSALHIKPNSRIDVSITAIANEKRKISEETITAKIQPIVYTSENTKDWDDRMKVIKWFDVPVKSAGKNETNANANQANSKSDLHINEAESSSKFNKNRTIKEKRIETESEPPHTILPTESLNPSSQNDKFDIDVSVSCNYATLPGDLGFEEDGFDFGKILMYKNKSETFTWNNDGNASLNFKWDIIYNSRPVSAIPAGARPPSRAKSYLSTALPTSMRSPTNEIETFVVEPAIGSIPVGKSQEFKVQFNPNDVKHFGADIYCQIENLEKDVLTKPIGFKVKGTGILPSCHVDLPSNDWISLRRPADLELPLHVPTGTPMENKDYHTVEMTAVGLLNTMTKSFWLINPTKDDYECEWSNPDSITNLNFTKSVIINEGPIDKMPGFKSKSNLHIQAGSGGTTTGVFATGGNNESELDSNNEKERNNKAKSRGIKYTILQPNFKLEAGKKVQINIAFEAKHIEPITECVWKLTLQSGNRRKAEELKFLMVGHVTEPNVYLDRAYLSLGRLLLNHKTTQTINLINKENMDYNFNIIPESCYSEGKQSSLTITPSSGKVLKNSKLQLNISYEAKSPGESTFNVLVTSVSFSKPISLKVKIESHRMNAKLVYEPCVETSAVLNPTVKQVAALTSGSNQSLDSGSSDYMKSLAEDAKNNTNPVVLQEYPFVNKLHFGTMQLNEKSIAKFYVKNIGRFPFDYEWTKINGSKTISISENPSGIVNVDAFKKCVIEYQPKQVGSLMSTDLKLKVHYGPTYLLSLSGKCIEPSLYFSMKAYDFGNRFIHRPGMQVNYISINIVNHDNIDISLEITNKPVSWLDIQFKPTVLPPGETVGVTVIFNPEKAMKYIETINFLVNGLSTKSVVITGRGCEMRLEIHELFPQKLSSMIDQQIGKIAPGQNKLPSGGHIVGIKNGQTLANSYRSGPNALRDSLRSNWKVGKPIRQLKLGHILPKTSCMKRIRLVNTSACDITGQVALSGPSEPALVDPRIFSVTSTEGDDLSGSTITKNGGHKDYVIKFMPNSRIPPFKEMLNYEIPGQTYFLAELSGACASVQLRFDTYSLPFGNVSLGSSNNKKLLMTNTGDIGSKFEWDTEQFKPDFSISPERGFIAAGQEVVFTIVFKPTKINSDIRYDKLFCRIDSNSAISGKSQKSNKIYITLTGMCSNQPPSKETVSFNCQVRNSDTRMIPIQNKTSQVYRIHPIIEGRHWSGDEVLVVEPLSTKQYEVAYSPLTMTNDKKHLGSIFFPLPDGTGLLYTLIGTAEQPKYAGIFTEEVPCKTQVTKLLPVENWLTRTQRFKVSIDPIKPDKLDNSVRLPEKLEYIDVGPNEVCDYKLNFYAYKDTTCTLKITFKNEKSGEFLSYSITFKAVQKPDNILESIKLSCPVRRSIQKKIILKNPLNYQLTFTTECKVGDIYLPGQLSVPANETYPLNIEYMPVKVGEQVGKLIVYNSELGYYSYELRLTATSAPTEQTQLFNASLGTSQLLPLKFYHIGRTKTDYICKIDSTEWTCEKSVPAAAANGGSGTEVTVDLTYEPTKLGTSVATLTLSSISGGEYVFPLKGICKEPRPQGPYVIKTKQTISIPFKNVFNSPTVFNFEVDSPAFMVKSQETYNKKKTYNISVSFDYDNSGAEFSSEDGEENPSITGRLIVRSGKVQGGKQLEWVYYLKGVMNL